MLIDDGTPVTGDLCYSQLITGVIVDPHCVNDWVLMTPRLIAFDFIVHIPAFTPYMYYYW